MQIKAKMQLISLENQIIEESLHRILLASSRVEVTPLSRPKKESALSQANKNLTLWGSERSKVKIKSFVMQGSTQALKSLLRTKFPEGVYVRLTLVEQKSNKI